MGTTNRRLFFLEWKSPRARRDKHKIAGWKEKTLERKKRVRKNVKNLKVSSQKEPNTKI